MTLKKYVLKKNDTYGYVLKKRYTYDNVVKKNDTYQNHEITPVLHPQLTVPKMCVSHPQLIFPQTENVRAFVITQTGGRRVHQDHFSNPPRPTKRLQKGKTFWNLCAMNRRC